MVGPINRTTLTRLLADADFRNYNQIFGYPLDLTPIQYRALYERGDLAARIADAYPNATGRERPEISAPGWDALEAFHDLIPVLARLDRLTQLGHYGVLLLGFDDGARLDEPVAKGSATRLLYAQPHGELTAQVSRWDANPKSPRFGKPELYLIESGVNWTGTGAGKISLTVHHSRVVHVAENALEQDSIGLPRLERIWNRIADMHKLAGASAEIFWQNVAQIIAFVASNDSEWEPAERDEMAKQIEEMQSGLRRFLRLRGVEPHQLAAGLQGASPRDFVDIQLDLIAGASGIPKRILIGSERGELASTQDENNWAARISERREQFATPNVLVPLIDQLQFAGVLPENSEYEIIWPEADSIGESDRAAIGLQKAQAIATIANAPGAGLYLSDEEIRGLVGLEGEAPNPGEMPVDETDPDVIQPFNQMKKGAA